MVLVPGCWLHVLFSFRHLLDLFLTIDQHFEQVSQHLDAFLDFLLDQLHHTLREVPVETQSFGRVVVLHGPLNELIGVNHILLLEKHLGNLEESISAVKLVLFGVYFFRAAFLEVNQRFLVVELGARVVGVLSSDYRLAKVKVSLDYFSL